MATFSVENHNQIICSLSNLPDALLITILSLLPNHIAARTSVLCRRFRHLWEASPSLNFTIRDIPEPKSDNFIAMVDRTLLRRNPSYALHSLHLNLHDYGSFRLIKHVFFISSLFAKASALRVRHLTVRGCMYLNSHIIPIIFSTDSLRSLSVDSLLNPYEESDVPYENTLGCLKFLELGVSHVNPIKFERFISELSSLEELSLKVRIMYAHELRISSKTITKLKLIFCDTRDLDNVMLSLPSLDLLELYYCGSSWECLPHFHGEISLLRKVVLALSNLRSRDACSVTGLLNCMSHAEELSLQMREDRNVKHPFPILLELGRSAPNFLNLKHFDVTACFHRYNFEAVVTMLHHSPALESVNLVHESTWEERGRKTEDWESNLPHNDDGDNCYAYFRNLHLGENREEFMKWITTKHTSRHINSLELPSLVFD